MSASTPKSTPENTTCASNEDRAQVLIEALPYLRRFRGHTMVIKYGGAAMTDESLRANVLQDVVLLRYVGMEPILVHGGGPEITELMERLGKQPTFVQGLRVTDAETVEIAQMALVGKTNQDLVGAVNREGGRAIGLSGKDASLLVARKHLESGHDLGFVGAIEEVRTELILTLVEHEYLPIIAPIAVGREGETYNVNADHVAGKVAGALRASKLIVLSDVAGVLADPKDPSSLISVLTSAEAKRMIAAGAASEGMIPKLQACVEALDEGVERCHIIDGRRPHALLMEIFTDAGIGTMVTR